jgi:DNA-binding transcriptional regulator PaaX
MRTLPKTATRYIIEGLIPYTEPNLTLAFKPGLFFADLEKVSNKSNQTIKNAYYKLIHDDHIVFDDDGIPRLTPKGLRNIKPYRPEKLEGAVLLVTFDIPENKRHKRPHLRLLLKELKFRQIQKSVWASGYDHREYLAAEIEHYSLENYVLVYEARKILG